MNKRDQLRSEYNRRIKDIDKKSKAAREIAYRLYEREVNKLDKADLKKLADLAGGATVGKPKRSKARDTRSRS